MRYIILFTLFLCPVFNSTLTSEIVYENNLKTNTTSLKRTQKSKNHYKLKQLRFSLNKLKKSKKSIKKTQTTKTGAQTLMIIGIVFYCIFMIIGLVFLLFGAWLTSVIFFLIALLFCIPWAIGGQQLREIKMKESMSIVTQQRTESTQKANDMDKVIYLQNGSIIKCQLIEMVPNKTVKIKTADGSIYVYKMEEVIKLEDNSENSN